ncbi:MULTISPECIES: DUF4249 domain-containing protein [unclassified Imperialibacter]|uniref:DUF4249 domain-containing protein n=1 Tax=unclassified Imperialibacter TaxID=2629706 RepID=UPI0012555DFE|nr:MULTISPECIES: DUF4249 domain-containing protein [unclassified Imperialibacter]CAD5258536.1 exported hypothetical protein [Imperialibacter sp. 75]CAD5261669.1 exported hypothetical protein [Imperialibacter sp. 89]VVT24582.1 exported hypothetical protein [Imperialibacter sp. EC-SDR9]
MRSVKRYWLAPYLAVLLPAFLPACVEQFELDIPRSTQNFVVEAILLDDTRFQKVVLSKINLDGKSEPFDDARVVLQSDNDDIEIVFESRGEGLYTPLVFVQIARGDKYRLVIDTDEETRIVSDWEEVPEDVALEGGYWESHTFEFVNDNGVTIKRNGINFRANTGTFQSPNTFLRYDFETAHINEAPFRDPRCDCLNCYIISGSDEFLNITSATESEGKSIKDHLITFLPLDKRFSFRLTMLVRQIAITRNAFLFYQSIDQQRNLNGSIFDPPPAIIKGNLYVEEKKDINVYGLFEVGRLSEIPITIYKSNIKNEFLTYLDICYAGARINNVESFCFSCYAEEGASPRPYYFE